MQLECSLYLKWCVTPVFSALTNYNGHISCEQPKRKFDFKNAYWYNYNYILINTACIKLQVRSKFSSIAKDYFVL